MIRHNSTVTQLLDWHKLKSRVLSKRVGSISKCWYRIFSTQDKRTYRNAQCGVKIILYAVGDDLGTPFDQNRESPTTIEILENILKWPISNMYMHMIRKVRSNLRVRINMCRRTIMSKKNVLRIQISRSRKGYFGWIPSFFSNFLIQNSSSRLVFSDRIRSHEYCIVTRAQLISICIVFNTRDTHESSSRRLPDISIECHGEAKSYLWFIQENRK